MNIEDREEFRQDLLEESKQNEWHEMMMEQDYDYFLESLDEEADAITELYYKVKEIYSQWGWEDNFDINEIIK